MLDTNLHLFYVLWVTKISLLMIRPLLCILMFAFAMASAYAQQAVGQWTDLLSYRNVTAITNAGERLYCASVGGLFSYDLGTHEIDRFSKVTGLSEVGVVSLGYSEIVEAVVVGYKNGNVDVIKQGEIYNLSDIVNSNIIGDKGIYSIITVGDDAWLGCGFGIVVIDLIDLEVRDTYLLGDLGTNTKVNDILVEDDLVYAATDRGIRFADPNTNLADFSNWGRMQDALPDPNGEYKVIKRLGGRLLTYTNGNFAGAYSHDGVAWAVIGGTQDNPIQDLSVNDFNMLIVYTTYFEVRNFLGDWQYNIITYPFENNLQLNGAVLSAEGDVWVADKEYALVTIIDGETTSILPDSPYIDVVWKVIGRDGEIWLAHGEQKSNYDNVFSDKGMSSLYNGQWHRGSGDPIFETVRDLVDVEFDPVDPDKVHFASFFGGLLTYSLSTHEYLIQNAFEGNSNLEGSSLLPDRVQSASLEYDVNGNLWVTNSYTSTPFKIKQPDGTWLALGCPGVLPPTIVYGDMAITEEGQTWAILPRSVGLVLLQHENDLVNTSNHQCKRFSTAVGDGGLPTTSILSIEEDLDGEIWVGTSEGPVVNYSPQSIFTNNPVDFQPILVERDGNVERLLGSESITAIEVDGANRKWIGTLTGGVFLLSDDGTEEILHFTEENSPLFSNIIKDIGIDEVTGAVHFVTNAGVNTYVGDATGSAEKNECFDVYPNPVRPEYRGPITIDGLVGESEVKITDLSGNIVFQTISNGGRATWQGTDFSGKRVSTGVYFALVSEREGESTCISKILFIN